MFSYNMVFASERRECLDLRIFLVRNEKKLHNLHDACNSIAETERGREGERESGGL